jgi:hypothetical protein
VLAANYWVRALVQSAPGRVTIIGSRLDPVHSLLLLRRPERGAASRNAPAEATPRAGFDIRKSRSIVRTAGTEVSQFRVLICEAFRESEESVRSGAVAGAGVARLKS